MVGAAGAFIVFALLLPGLAPNIYVGDSQLFSTASYYLSTAHPPGYPLFTTIGKLFTFIPFGSIPFRVGLVAALFASLSWIVLFKLINRLTLNKAMAFSFSFLPVLTPLAYTQSIEQKGVYSLNSFLCLLMLYLGVRAYEEADVRFLYAMAFLFGLGAGNHHTLALFLLPSLVPLWVVSIRERRFASLAWLPVFFAGGFLIYLHLYLRSLALINKGFIYSEATTLHDFFAVLFRKGYTENSIQAVQTLAGPHETTACLNGAKNIIRFVLASQYGAAMTAIFLISIVWLLFSRERKALKAYLVLAVLPWVFILPSMTIASPVPDEHDISVVSQYYMPLLFLLPVFISLMANRAWLYLKAKKIRTLRAAQVCLLLPFFYLPTTFQHSLGSSYIAYDHAKDTLSVMPVNSVLLLYGDNPTFGDYYIQWVERYREDVLAFNRGAHTQIYEIGRSGFLFNQGLFRDYMRLEGPNTLKTPYSSLDTLCREERFFAIHPIALTNVLKKRYQTGSGYAPLAYMLFIRRTPTVQADEFLLENYQKLNYERTAMAYSNDPLVNEEKNQYGFALIGAATLTNDKTEKNSLQDEAMRLVAPESFMPWVTAQTLESGGEAGALDFLHKIESGLRYSKMADLAHVMEYIVLSDAGSPQAGPKYVYLKEHGLLEYLAGASSLSKDLAMTPKNTVRQNAAAQK